MPRDISAEQLDRELQKRGFKPRGFCGYYLLPEPFLNTSVSILNAGPRRRDQLAYMINTFERLKVPEK